MTLLQQEAHKMIDRMSDKNVRYILTIIRQMEREDSRQYNQPWKKDFLESLRDMEFDTQAIDELRERSII